MSINRYLIVCLLWVSFVLPVWAQSTEYKSDNYIYRMVTVIEALKDPWSLTFLPNGDMLVTERQGRLRIVRAGKLDPEPISGTPSVRYQGQGGLLDVVLHPDFAKNQLIYLSYSKPNAEGTQGTTAVVRGKFDGKSLSGVEEIFEAKAWSEGGSHYGSRLAFDPKGYLFITVGDRAADPLGVPREQHPSA